MKSLCIALIVAGTALSFAGSAEAGPYRTRSIVYSEYSSQYPYSVSQIYQPYYLDVTPVVIVPPIRYIPYYEQTYVVPVRPIVYFGRSVYRR